MTDQELTAWKAWIANVLISPFGVKAYRDVWIAGYRAGISSVHAKCGKAGGIARAKALTPKRRKQIAQQGASARWKKEAAKPHE